IDDIWPQERFYFRSDHYNFARKGVPILFFFNGTHADYHQVGDSPDKIDAEKESRIVKLLCYLGLEVANAAERPKWNPESYKQIVTGANLPSGQRRQQLCVRLRPPELRQQHVQRFLRLVPHQAPPQFLFGLHLSRLVEQLLPPSPGPRDI